MNKVPDLTSMDAELLKQKYQGAINSLYLGQQCPTCGNRFPPQPSSGSAATVNRYGRHLDWHFRQNKKEKLEANKAHSRAWYYSLGDWMLYEELSDEKSPSPNAASNPASSSMSASTPQTSASAIDGIDEDDLVNSAYRSVLNSNY